MPMNPQEMIQMLQSQGVQGDALEKIMSAVTQMSGMEVEGKIPGSIAGIAMKGATLDAAREKEQLRLSGQILTKDQAFNNRLEELRIRSQLRERETETVISAQKANRELLRQRMMETIEKIMAQPGPLSGTARVGIEMLEGKEFEAVDGAVYAAEAKEALTRKLNNAGMGILTVEQPLWERSGIKMPPSLIDKVKETIQIGGSVDDVLARARIEAIEDKRLGRTARKLGERITQRGGTTEAAARVRESVGPAQSIEAEFAKREAIKTAYKTEKAGLAPGKWSTGKRLGYGAAGAGLTAYILSKMLGKKETAGMPPQLQMMMLQQAMQQQARGQDGEGKVEGRELMNLSRAMSIIKMVQSMNNMQSEQQPSMSRII